MVSILGAAVALFAVSASTASAAAIVAPTFPYCYGATYGANTAQVCAAENIVIGNGTIDPGASTDCIIKVPALNASLSADIVRPPAIYPCRLAGQVITGVGTTGFTPSGAAIYGPTIVGLSVRHQGYPAGTLWVDGGSSDVGVSPFCVGGGCPTSLDMLLQLVTVQ
jgi:hypothetical protein